MADPISIVSLLAVALHTSRVVYELIERVKDAPQDVLDISSDSMAIRKNLLHLQKTLDDGEAVVSGIEDGLREPLENTSVILKSVENTIAPFDNPDKPRWKGLEWAMKQKEINKLKKKLRTAQEALAMALAITLRSETKFISAQTHAIMNNQNETLENVANFSTKLDAHTQSMTNAQVAILDTFKGLGDKLEAKQIEANREDVWHNPTDVIGLSKYLESVAVARYSPPPTNAAGISTFDEDFDDDSPPPELQSSQAPALVKHDLEADIEELLSQSSEKCAMSDEGQTALHLAAQQDSYLTVKVLAHGFRPDEPNIEGETPLMLAVMAGNIETAKVLLKAGANVNATGEDGRTPLHYAAAHNRDTSITQLLLRRKANIGAVSKDGLTGLFTAAILGNDIICRHLIENGDSVQARVRGGWTALHYLAMRGKSTGMARLLSGAGADVEVFYDPDRYGLQSSAAYDTSSKRKVALVKPFLDNGVDVDARINGFTALNIAVLTCQDLLVTSLLSHGASAQGTSLVCLNWGLSIENLEQLLERGADIEARDSRHGKTALIWASETGSPAAVKALLDHGAHVNAQDSQGLSSLRYAAANARTETVRLLLEKGADPSLPDRFGTNPLIAVARARPFSLGGRFYNPSLADREKTASLLIDAGADLYERHTWTNATLHAASNGYLELLKLFYSKATLQPGLKQETESLIDIAQEKRHGHVVRWLKRQLLLDVAVVSKKPES